MKNITIQNKTITNLITNGDKSNANMMHNPETIHKHVADNIMKQYALKELIPTNLAKAHQEGFYHIHDLEYFANRSMNCCQHDLRYFIKHGLAVDGNGEHTSVAKPPSRMETLMNHSGEILLAAQQNMSGGQGFPLWNVFAAPFAVGRSDEEVKQCVEMLVFNLNMAYAARGGQVPFTSIALEFTVPDFLVDEPAWGPGGKVVGVYGDYVDEVKRIQRAFTEVLFEGDAYNKPHLFPNTIYMLRRECLTDEFESDLLRVHELSNKFGSSYFVNMLPDYMGDLTTYMGCRTRLSDDWTGNWEQDCLRTGNLAYVTLNLPRMAYMSKDETEFFDYIQEYMTMAQEVLLLRRKQSEDIMNDYKLLPFLSQHFDDEPYYRMDNSSLTFGFVGLNEAMKSLTGNDLTDEDANNLGLKTLTNMNHYSDEIKDVSGLRQGIIQTPAESTAYRFANIDMQKYKDKIIYQGTEDVPYYTNSSHVPVTFDGSLVDKIHIESNYHPLTKAGHILHAFMGEQNSDPRSLMSLTDKICNHSDIGFWAYSSAFSQCLRCKTIMKGLVNKCTACGETGDVEWYDRITGYVQQVGHATSSNGGWNKGKQQELIDRYRW